MQVEQSSPVIFNSDIDRNRGSPLKHLGTSPFNFMEISDVNSAEGGPELLQMSKKMSRFGNNTRQSKLGNILKNIAQMLQKKKLKPRLGLKYYQRRKSCGALNAALDSTISAIPERFCEDDLYIRNDYNSSGKAKRKREQDDADEGLNTIICEVLLLPDLKEHITNKTTLEFIGIKVLKYGADIAANSRKELITKLMGDNKQGSKVFDGIHANSTGEMKVGIKTSNKARRKAMETKRRSMIQAMQEKTERKIKLMSLSHGPMDRRSVTSKNIKDEPDNSKLDDKQESVQFIEMKKRLNGYLPIALFLADWHKYEELEMKIIYYDPKITPESRATATAVQIMETEEFVKRLVTACVKYDEHKVFDLVLQNVKNWDLYFSDSVIDIYIKYDKMSFMVTFLNVFNEVLATHNRPANKKKPVALQSPQLRSPSPSRPLSLGLAADNIPNSAPTVTLEDHKFNIPNLADNGAIKGKMVAIVKKFLHNKEGEATNQLVMDLLKNLKYTDAGICELLVRTGEEARVEEILLHHPNLVRHLDKALIIELKLYKVLRTLDPMELIDVFNLPSIPDNPSSISLYNELCTQMKAGVKIQSICFLIMYVNITFWDFDKLWKFYLALNEMMRYESKNNWLAYVDNPLLFCMKHASFFKKVTRMLDVDSKEIHSLTSDLVKFCVKYIENSSEETLILQFFEKDSHGLNFFDYTFMVKKMDILEIDYVANVILNMWDLGRHSKQSLTDFFKLNVLKHECKKFRLSIFRASLEMPIEDTDSFQLEFYLTSRSVYLSVLNDIIWPYSLIALEFYFSMEIVRLYLEETEHAFTRDLRWIWNFYKASPVFYTVLAALRLAYIVTLIQRSLVIGTFYDAGTQIRGFYNTILFLNFVQLLIYPLMGDHFWLVNNVQMLIVLAMICYSFYLGLSLKGTGVILRIFARMVSVVVIFSIVSIIIITLIAYPIHTLYLLFSQKAAGETFPEQNMFRSLYNGVLTLFEFVFGAVIFVRPYAEQNIYTYTMTFFMVIFSFFGNIMLANMLVAFLANQFNLITKKAKYYTLRMQFGLTKVLRPLNLDTLYSMPYFFNILFLPLYILMIGKGVLRHKINRLLRMFIHLFTVFIPWFIYYTLYLSYKAIYMYLSNILQILSQLRHGFLALGYILVWLIAGIPFLLKLYFEDIFFMCKIMLSFADCDENDLLRIRLGTEDRENLVQIYEKIAKVGQGFMERGLTVVSLGEFIFEMKKQLPRPQYDQSKEDRQDEGRYNRNKFLFTRKYKLESLRLYKFILTKFISHDDRVSGVAHKSQEVDLKFLLDKFRNNLNTRNITALISFDKSNLELARKEMQRGNEKELKSEVASIKSRVEEINKNMEILTRIVMKTAEYKGQKSEKSHR